MTVKKLQDLLSESIKMEINELDEKLIPEYLVTENNFLESEIAKVRAKLEENNKKIEPILNLKNIRWDDIKTIKMASYASVAKLIADTKVSESYSIFYFYNDNGNGLVRIDAIKCSELPKYKDNFETYELLCNKIKTMIKNSGENNLYYIKGFYKGSHLNNEFNIDTSSVTCIGTIVCSKIDVMSKVEV